KQLDLPTTWVAQLSLAPLLTLAREQHAITTPSKFPQVRRDIAILIDIEPKFYKVFRVLFFMPTVLSVSAIAIIWKWQFDTNAGFVNGIIALFGFLVLSGVVVNNGIVFIDTANQQLANGMELNEALIATGKMRLRPILMTALTTILGLSTMALGIGQGAEMMAPMAIVTIGGLIYATFMTLYIVPDMYAFFHRGKRPQENKVDS
ncbi:MAG: hypothetical protein EOM64_08675, partial [Erysipelotrichia bacterium]|nr:hypothetical protein [Erysipelotrichia bacterium]